MRDKEEVMEFEIRLWDRQWMNIVNHNNCWRNYATEDALYEVIRMVEETMSKNFHDNKWPPQRG